jgi:DNA repair exonuclease SbcCD ATPase subunit
MITLDDSNKNIKQIYHLSDIHIRLDKTRHEEYRLIFASLYDYLKNDTNDNSLIVVTGDIVHSKTTLKPECIYMVKDFFLLLTEISDVIVILGNHDCNINNKESLDSISSIVEKGFTGKNKIYILQNNENYVYNNIVFGNTNIYSKIITPPMITNKIKIGLYHGQVCGSHTHFGFELNGVKCEEFNGYDIVMLGDVHKFQYLNDEKTIAYASSLIQQDYSEDLLDHGLLKWNIETKQSEFIRINNNYGFITLTINDKNFEIPNLPKFPRIKIIHKNLTTNDLVAILDKIREKYAVEEIITIKDMTNLNIDLEMNDNKFDEIKNATNVSDVIKKYMEEKKEIQINKDLIMEKIIEILNNLKYNYDIEPRNIKIKKIEFSNMFSYGKNNIIEFDNWNKIVGLVAPNHFGKSSIIDILLYGIYGQCSRGNKYECLNINANDFFVKIVLNVNENEYKIERKGKRKGKTFESDLILSKNGKIMTGDTKMETENEILKSIGKYDDFVNVNCMLQGTTGFVELPENKRKDIIYEVLRLDVFRQIIKEVKSRMGNIYYILTEYKNDIEKIDIIFVKNKLKSNRIINTKILNEIKFLNKELENINIKIQSNASKINDIKHIDEIKKELEECNYENDEQILNNISIDIEEGNVNELYEQLDKLYKNKKTIKENYEINVEEMNEIKMEIEENKKYIIEVKIDLEKIDKIDRLIEKIEKLNNEKEIKIKKYNEIKYKLNLLKNHQYNKDCWACMSNNITKEKIELEEEIKIIENKIKHIDKKINKKEKEINDMEQYEQERKQMKENEEIVIENKRLEKILDEMNNILENQENEKKINEMKIKIEKVKNFNKRNELIEKIKIKKEKEKVLKEELEKLNAQENLIEEKEKHENMRNQINIKLEELTKKLTNLTNENTILKMNKTKYEEIKEKINEKNNEKEIYDSVQDILGKNGMIDDLFNNTIIPQLNIIINHILRTVTNFSIIVEYDKTNIKLYKQLDSKRIGIELISGYEKFIVNIAFRLALAQINKYVMFHCFIIDEGFSCCDDENLDKVKELYEYIKRKYEWCLVISHMDKIKDTFDMMIHINKKDNLSYIEY